MSIKRLFDAVERRGDIGRRVAALVLPISNRARVTSSCAGKIGLREPGEHTTGPNLASRDNVAHNENLYTILETPPPVHPALSKAGPDILGYSMSPRAHAARLHLRRGGSGSRSGECAQRLRENRLAFLAADGIAKNAAEKTDILA